MSGYRAVDEIKSAELRKQAAHQAVDEYVKSGTVIGLGTGSAVTFIVERVGELLKSGALKDVLAVPTSTATKEQAESLGIPITTLDVHSDLDVAFDGADAVDIDLNVVKGGSGDHSFEKMVAASAKQFVVLVGESKMCKRLGPHCPVPVEILQGCHKHTMRQIGSLPALAGCKPVLRLKTGVAPAQPFVTGNGNYIVDLEFTSTRIEDVFAAARQLTNIIGVVEHGLFVGMTTACIISMKDGTVDVKRQAYVSEERILALIEEERKEGGLIHTAISKGIALALEEPLKSLGPFDVKPANFSAMGLVVDTSGSVGRHRVDLDQQCFRSLAAEGIFHLSGSAALSPFSPLTLGLEARKKARIPENAVKFCFAYPVSGFQDAVDKKKLDIVTPEVSFLAHGGFMYLDSVNEVCGVNSLYQPREDEKPAQGLRFSGKQQFSYPDVIKKLGDDQRLQRVTVASLAKKGVKEFCWLYPNETFPGLLENGSSWSHGAFLYTYSGHHEQNCFFSVA